MRSYIFFGDTRKKRRYITNSAYLGDNREREGLPQGFVNEKEKKIIRRPLGTP